MTNFQHRPPLKNIYGYDQKKAPEHRTRTTTNHGRAAAQDRQGIGAAGVVFRYAAASRDATQRAEANMD